MLQDLDPVRSGGLLLIDKPLGISSFDIIRKLRRQTSWQKIGHAGTLDPLATGLMLMLFGSACKKASQLSGLDKWYEAEITLGANSATGDGEGPISAVSDRIPDLSAVNVACQQFVGTISQTPSQYSAIKIGGTEAYKLARAGKQVTMPSRQVTVYSIEIDNYAYPKLRIIAHVSSGTYIRTLAEDIGAGLAVGGYISALRRTRVGEYDIGQASQLAVVENQNLKFIEP